MNRFGRRGAGRAWLAVFALVFVPLGACEQGREGDRCNPALVQTSSASSPNGGAYDEDECNAGFACTVPPTCVIAVCCPAKPPYTDPSCACLADPGAACACTVQSLDGGPFESDDAGPVNAEPTTDAASAADAAG